jgi:hypothetical protein
MKMMFFRKIIILIAVSCSLKAFCNETFVTFPHDTSYNETPGWSQIVSGEIINESNICFQGNEKVALSDLFTQIVSNCNANFYFPLNGKQPTTTQTTVFSCADIESDDVTEWYMKMYGWIKEDDSAQSITNTIYRRLKMGFTPENDVIPIITFAPITSNKHPTSKYSNINLQEKRKSFWEIFRQIAANPVGRVLLYRLLLEIRRTNSLGNGTAEKPFYNPQSIAIRNNLRSLAVCYDNTWRFGHNGIIYFSDDPNISTAVVAKGEKGALRTKVQSCPLCIPLFHEMLHWFHCLRYYRRAISEADFDRVVAFAPYPEVNSFYFKSGEDPNTPGNTWAVIDRNGSVVANKVDLEEMRTILGINNITKSIANVFTTSFLEGDDISENLFRCSLSGKPKSSHIYMRYGHGGVISSSPVKAIKFDPQIRLAHRVTFDTADIINPNAKKSWDIIAGGAVAYRNACNK